MRGSPKAVHRGRFMDSARRRDQVTESVRPPWAMASGSRGLSWGGRGAEIGALFTYPFWRFCCPKSLRNYSRTCYCLSRPAIACPNWEKIRASRRMESAAAAIRAAPVGAAPATRRTNPPRTNLGVGARSEGIRRPQLSGARVGLVTARQFLRGRLRRGSPCVRAICGNCQRLSRR